MSAPYEWPHFLDLKRKIVSATTQELLTTSWNDVLDKLSTLTAEIAQAGSNFIPQVNFADLDDLTPEEIDVIKRKGSVVIHDVVDSKTASGWKTELGEFVKANPKVEGIPHHNKQFFHIYWARSQVQARAHPNVLKATTWINNLYHIKSGKTIEGVDLSVPLTYADRFRIRHPGGYWGGFPPHIDSGAIERWEDDSFRRSFEEIFKGNWRQYDPYELEHRYGANSSLYGRAGQASVFRTFQGWLAMAEIAPTQGTLRVFPDVQASNAYIMLRPFFRPTVPEGSPDIFDPKNWEFDISSEDFPGIVRLGRGFGGPMPTNKLHPHLRLEETMTSVPKVAPGDMVFWHGDMIHSVETEHTGSQDSAVMYIGAVPKTPQNSDYVAKQVRTFLAGQNPPDFARAEKGAKFVGLGADADVEGPVGRAAMGLPIDGPARRSSRCRTQ